MNDAVMLMGMQIADGAVTVKGALTEAMVVTPDVEACKNTIVHVIDSVLVPCNPKFGKLPEDCHESASLDEPVVIVAIYIAQ